MKLFFFSFLVLMSLNSFAGTKVVCTGLDYTLELDVRSSEDIKIKYLDETVQADGAVTQGEIDLVARFKRYGEISLFAQVGKTGPDNYLFISGKRISVICR